MVDEKILKVLACPKCKKDVFLKEEKITCVNCGRRYPIKEKIPIMLIEEAEPNDDCE